MGTLVTFSRSLDDRYYYFFLHYVFIVIVIIISMNLMSHGLVIPMGKNDYIHAMLVIRP